jgi:hypothetical protein
MNLAVVVNILDLVAFFLVTIDLYGRNRVHGLSQRLKNIHLPNPGSIRWSPRRGTPGEERLWHIYTYSFRAVFVVWLIGELTMMISSMIGGGFKETCSARWSDCTGWLGGQVAVGGLLVLFFFQVIWVIGVALTRFVIFVAKLYLLIEFEGALIMTGTLLFVLARTTAIWVSWS